MTDPAPPPRRVPTALLASVVPLIAAVTAVVTFTVTDDTSGSTTTGGKPTVQIQNFEFDPTPLMVAPDTTITVVNLDDARHTLTADTKGDFDTGELAGNQKATIKVGNSGKYSYFCQIHDYMQGVIEVGE